MHSLPGLVQVALEDGSQEVPKKGIGSVKTPLDEVDTQDMDTQDIDLHSNCT